MCHRLWSCVVCLCLFCMNATTLAAGEPPRFEWALSAGGTQHDKTRGIAVDPDGNVLLTGEFTGTAKFGDIERTAVGSMDFFLAKVDPQGKFLWVRTGGGDLIDRGYAVASDAAGNAYVTGHYESATATFDGVTIKTVGQYDLFVAKYDAAGKLLWIKSGGGAGYDYGHGVAADRHGHLFVTGAVVGVGAFAGQPLGAEGGSHVFCLMLDGDGQLAWQRSASGAGGSSGHGVAADQQGNCYVGGYVGGVSALAGREINNSAGQDLLVAKFDARGELKWLHTGHGSSSAMVHEITADEAGNVWAAGMFKGDLKLADRSVANQGQHDLLSTGFDATGKRLWTRTAGAAGIDYGLGVATDGQGSSFFTGSFTGAVDFDGTTRTSRGPASDIHIVKYARDRAPQWFLQAGSERTDHAYTIVSDGRGNLYLSGACSGAAQFGEHAVPHRGSNDLFLAKIRDAKP